MADTLYFFAEHYLVTVLAAIAFVIFIRCDVTDSRNSMRGFVWSAICISLLCFAETMDNYFASFTQPTVMRVATSVICYAARPAMILFVILMPAKKYMPKLAKFLVIPLIIDFLIYATAFFSPIAFSFDDGNHFNRGPLGYASFVVSAIYLVILIFFCFLRVRRGEIVDIIICSTAVIACAVGVFMEFELSHFGILPGIAIFSEIFYFMYQLMTKYSTDYLTGAYIRSHMYKEVASRKGDRYYIIFDVNGLKKINDTNGHDAGDKALLTFAGAVFGSLPTTALFYRLGGDEFAIIYRTGDEKKVLKLINEIKKQCESMPYGVSYGYAYFCEKEDFAASCKTADDMLYENKRRFWDEYEKAKTQDSYLA